MSETNVCLFVQLLAKHLRERGVGLGGPDLHHRHHHSAGVRPGHPRFPHPQGAYRRIRKPQVCLGLPNYFFFFTLLYNYKCKCGACNCSIFKCYGVL